MSQSATEGKKAAIFIGGAGGGSTDSTIGIPQLLSAPTMHYLILDFLSEPSFGPKAQAMAAGAPGFDPDFLNTQLLPNLSAIKARGVRVITNAGIQDPRGLASAIRKKAVEAGIVIKVVSVQGDNLLGLMRELKGENVREMFSGAPLPERITSANAYAGAFPIAAALARGADIVVTGRVVDSALALGPLIHEFGWQACEYDKLAAGTAVGHLLECGAQSSGGTFTDWRDVPGWENIGFPIAECYADGLFELTKTPGTGGLVSLGTVSEQFLYEVSNPQTYFVPDVVCDFTQINLAQIGPDRVRVSGIRGYPPTSTYKVCATYDIGWGSTALWPVLGFEAVAKARRQARALLDRSRNILTHRGWSDWSMTHVEIIGSEHSYGDRSQCRASREVILKIVVEHQLREAAELFWREASSSQMNMGVGTLSGIGASTGMPRVQARNGLFSFLIDKHRVPLTLDIDGTEEHCNVPIVDGFDPEQIVRHCASGQPQGNADCMVPLLGLAWARSGDKGNLFNVAVISRKAEYLPWIRKALTESAVAQWYSHFFADGSNRTVESFEVPGLHALNFVVHDALGGGAGGGSPYLDRSAKGMAQLLLEYPIPVPTNIAVQAEVRLRTVQPLLDYLDEGITDRGRTAPWQSPTSGNSA